MGRRSLVLTAVIGVVFLQGTASADEQAAKAVVDKAIKALGGEERLAKVTAFVYKNKSAVKFGGNEAEFSGDVTVQGMDHYRNAFGNDQFEGVVVLNRDKGWRRFGDNLIEMDADSLKNEKQAAYLAWVSTLVYPVKGQGFKVDSAPDETIGEKPVAVVKATGPDGKEFTMYFDKESGLLVKQKAKVIRFQGDEYTQETMYFDYKEFDGIKKATRAESMRDGEPFFKQEITDFKVMDKVPADTFSEPK